MLSVTVQEISTLVPVMQLEAQRSPLVSWKGTQGPIIQYLVGYGRPYGGLASEGPGFKALFCHFKFCILSLSFYLFYVSFLFCEMGMTIYCSVLVRIKDIHPPSGTREIPHDL